ncbi:MAG: hypothetical protein AB7G25_05070, partial [Sphingomonadaceae bacterium]
LISVRKIKETRLSRHLPPPLASSGSESRGSPNRYQFFEASSSLSCLTSSPASSPTSSFSNFKSSDFVCATTKFAAHINSETLIIGWYGLMPTA